MIQVIWTSWRCANCGWMPTEPNNVHAYDQVREHIESHGATRRESDQLTAFDIRMMALAIHGHGFGPHSSDGHTQRAIDDAMRAATKVLKATEGIQLYTPVSLT